MLDFDVQRCTRRCAKTERDLHPGETCYSVLVAEGANVVRYDYGETGWEGPPENAVGWWKSQVPEANSKRAQGAPNDVLRGYFQQLLDQPGREDVRYVVALLLVRRRIMRLEDTEKDEAGGETLVLFCPREEVEHRVPVVMPDERRAQDIQDEVVRLLYGPGT